MECVVFVCRVRETIEIPLDECLGLIEIEELIYESGRIAS